MNIKGGTRRKTIAEVILRAAAGDLARSNKQRDWAPINAVLIPPLFMEADIFEGETSAEY